MRRLLAVALCLLVQPATATQLTALFSPWDDIEGEIVKRLRAARQQVRVQAYILTSRVIARELAAAQRRGVDVKVLVDAEQVQRGNDGRLAELAQAGVGLRLETAYAAAHNKVMLIDPAGPAPIVMTGSYNFSWAAQARNAENLLLVQGDAALAARYLANWRRHCEATTPWPATDRPVPSAPSFCAGSEIERKP